MSGMTTLQQQARALGDPTRHAIFRYVADADDPVGVAELTDQFGLHHNAIRQHLTKLLDAGLVTETKVQRRGPGRPHLVYAVDPRAQSRWDVPGPYERLSMLLAEIIRTGDSPQEVGRRAAAQYRTGATDSTEVIDDLVGTMARLGFEPDVSRRGKRVDIVVATCPFASAALADPDIVCALHRGLAEGLTEGTGVVVEGLVTKDPRHARCRLRVLDG